MRIVGCALFSFSAGKAFKNEPSLLCRLSACSAAGRGDPQVPQYCSPATRSAPQELQMVPSDSALFAPSGVAPVSPAKAARFGLIFSRASSITERSSASDFFQVTSSSRARASVTNPAISWQL